MFGNGARSGGAGENAGDRSMRRSGFRPGQNLRDILKSERAQGAADIGAGKVDICGCGTAMLKQLPRAEAGEKFPTGGAFHVHALALVIKYIALQSPKYARVGSFEHFHLGVVAAIGIGKILTAGDHAFAWSGVPQVPNPDGCYYAEMKMLKGADPRVLWGLQCNVFDDQGKSMDMEGPSCWKFFPGLRTWKLLEHRRPASADVYLPGSDIGSALRTLRFQNVPQILPGPES
jgi:hypothetical protein